MQPLNERNLRALLEHLAESEDLDPPFDPMIVEYPGSVIYTDGALLLEWDKGLIDRRNSTYSKLRDKALSLAVKNEKLNGMISANCWTDVALKGCRLHPAQEVEPGECPPMKNALAYKCRSSWCHYHIDYLTAIEAFMNNARESDIFSPKKSDLSGFSYKCFQWGDHRDTIVLCPHDGKKLVGALAGRRHLDAKTNSSRSKSR